MKLVDGAEDDPPVMFAWKNVYVFVQAIHEAQAQAAAPGGVPLSPDPLGLPAAVTEEIFKEAVLEYARVQGAPPRLGTTCLPCSLAQFGKVYPAHHRRRGARFAADCKRLRASCSFEYSRQSHRSTCG
ncbi:hypothetical protein MHU86_7158 [Fragilaria crotonensis]|nr:hypothetical protein MHU86_7158 [Fragilaria crotonensis]